MKSAAFSLLGVAFGIKCNLQTPSYKLDRDGAIIDLYVDWPGIEFPGLTECGLGFYPDKWSCDSTKFAGSFTKTEKLSSGIEVVSSFNYESKTKGCAPSAVCEKLAGGVNGCQKATYNFQKWIPRTCNVDEDYNAITEDYNTSVTLSCCQSGGDYCNANEDYSGCTEVGTFSTYISDLNQCWTDYKREFMAELLCDNDGLPNRDILSWCQNCTEEDGSWKASLRPRIACKYRPTCADEMRATLIKFGECACSVATKSGYTGDFIGTAMQQNWQRFCPNVELSCASDTGIVELLYKYWVVKYKLLINLAASLIDDDVIAKIKAKIAERLNVDPITITVTTTGTRRRLLADETEVIATFTAEDENTKDYGETNMDAQLASDIGTEIGATTTFISVSYEEGSDATESSFDIFGNVGNISNATTTKTAVSSEEGSDTTESLDIFGNVGNISNVNIFSFLTTLAVIAAVFN